jgi:hypothetical protein
MLDAGQRHGAKMPHRSCLVCLLIASLTAAPSSQVHVRRHDGTPGDQMGEHVSIAGDADGDGVLDYVISAAFFHGDHPAQGRVTVHSGRDGSLIYAVLGKEGYELLGEAVSGAGDVDGGGLSDIIIGAPSAASHYGAARVISSETQLEIYEFIGHPEDFLGTAVSCVGDVDADGRADFLVGARGEDYFHPKFIEAHGAAHLYSGADGSEIHFFGADTETGAFGGSAAGPGDLDGDGVPDVLVGACESSAGLFNAGSVYAFSGRDGSKLYPVDGSGVSDGLGGSIAALGDVDLDGTPDFAAGAPQDSIDDLWPGYARVYSGADGTEILTVFGDAPKDWFGYAVGPAGDVDVDGRPDLAVGATAFGDDWSGYVRVVSSADGAPLLEIRAPFGQLMGSDLTGADLQADGTWDLIVGSHRAPYGGPKSGCVTVYAGVPSGVPLFDVTTTIVPGADVQLSLASLELGICYCIAVAPDAGPTSIPELGLEIDLGPRLELISVALTGQAMFADSITNAFPSDSLPVGLSFASQAFTLDPSSMSVQKSNGQASTVVLP